MADQLPYTFTTSQRWIFNQAVKRVKGTNKLIAKQYYQAQDNVLNLLAGYRQAGLTGTTPKEIRLQLLYNQIDKELVSLGVKTSGHIQTGFKNNYEETYYRVAYTVEREINVGKGFLNLDEGYTLNYPLLNTEAIYGALNEEVAGHTFKQRALRNRQQLQWLIRLEVSGAVVEGISVQELKKRLLDIDQAFRTGEARAMATARTELLRAYSLGDEQAVIEAEKAGVQFEHSWISTLDGKTRPSHQRSDKKKANLDNEKKPYWEINGVLLRAPRLVHPLNIKDSAAETIQCRCRAMHSPYNIKPTTRSAKVKGKWTEVPGNLNYAQWKKNLKK